MGGCPALYRAGGGNWRNQQTGGTSCCGNTDRSAEVAQARHCAEQNELNGMVTQLKDYARESTSESRIAMVQINDVLHSALELLSNPLKNATTALKVELAADLPRLQGDFYQLEQVFINLLMNACESLESSEQGIRLRTDMDPGEKANHGHHRRRRLRNDRKRVEACYRPLFQHQAKLWRNGAGRLHIQTNCGRAWRAYSLSIAAWDRVQRQP